MVKQQAQDYFNENRMTLETLKQFYQKYMHVVSGACEEVGTTTYELLKSRNALEQSLTAPKRIRKRKEILIL